MKVIMAAIMGALFLMSCGYDFPHGKPLYYLSVGLPVYDAASDFPHYEDMQAVLDVNMAIMGAHYGQDMRPHYLRYIRDNGAHILLTDDQHDMTYSTSAGEFDGVQIRVLYTSGCAAGTGFGHELIHLAQFIMEPGEMDFEHETPQFWNGPDSFVMQTWNATRRYCTGEFYSVYAEQQ